jgi:peptide maturation system acyl carrier-related protein
MNHNNVAAALNNLFFELFQVDAVKLVANYWNEDLMGTQIGLAPRDMLYLYLEIEQKFGISIPEEDIVQGHFRSLQGIEEVIKKQTALLCH